MLDANDPDPHLETARRVLASTPLIDGHNDLPCLITEWKDAPGDVEAYDLRVRAPGCTDLDRLEAGMVGAQFWAIYVACERPVQGSAADAFAMIALAKRIFAAYPDRFEEARNADDVLRVFASGRIASLLGVEGGQVLEDSLDNLRRLWELGVRYLTLTHNCTTSWADSAMDEPRHSGLTPFGVRVIREMNRLGMLVDLSHVSAATMHAALDVSHAPVIWSHAGARTLVDHPRNVPDDVLDRVPGNRGIVMVTFVPAFVSAAHHRWDLLETRTRIEERARQGHGDVHEYHYENPMPAATLSDVADHLDYLYRRIGPEHVGIGSDFEGTSRLVQGLEDVSTFPALFAEMSRRGWSEAELGLLAGGNILRVMREAEAAAARNP
jgi:membrane dipeptidase